VPGPFRRSPRAAGTSTPPAGDAGAPLPRTAPTSRRALSAAAISSSTLRTVNCAMSLSLLSLRLHHEGSGNEKARRSDIEAASRDCARSKEAVVTAAEGLVGVLLSLPPRRAGLFGRELRRSRSAARRATPRFVAPAATGDVARFHQWCRGTPSSATCCAGGRFS
jgi:hypothetical protein